MSSILFVSLPSSASEPKTTLAQFPVFLFSRLPSCYSPSPSLLCPHALCFLLTVAIDHSDLSDWLPSLSKPEYRERNRRVAERR